MEPPSPDFEACFASSVAQNLVAWASGEQVFMLLEGAIAHKVGNEEFVIHKLPYMLTVEPVMLLSNFTGTFLLIVSRYCMHIIRFNRQSNFEGVFNLKPQLLNFDISAEESIVDACFHPFATNYLTVAFSSGEIQIIDCNTLEKVCSIETGVNIRSIRFGHYSSLVLSHTLFVLDEEGHIYCLFPVLPSIEISGFPEKEQEAIDNGCLMQPFELIHNLPNPPVTFDFSDKYLVVADGEGSLSAANLSAFKPTFITQPKVLVDFMQWGNIESPIRLQSTPMLYGFADDSVYVITSGYIRMIMSSPNILGAGGSNPIALLSPGYVVPLCNESYAFTRVDPTLNDNAMLVKTEQIATEWDPKGIEQKLKKSEKDIDDLAKRTQQKEALVEGEIEAAKKALAPYNQQQMKNLMTSIERLQERIDRVIESLEKHSDNI